MLFENKNVHYPPRSVKAGRPGFLSKKYKQFGRSMIEMLGVLAIVGVLSAGGIAGYSMAIQSYKTTQLIERINLIATRVRTVYKNGDYTGVTRANMINSGKLSKHDFENPFGGSLTLNTNASLGYFYIFSDESNLPAETCVDLLQTDWGKEGVFSAIGLSESRNPSYRFDNGTYPVPLQTAITACEGGNKMIKVWFW